MASETMQQDPSLASADGGLTLRVLPVVAFTFVAYACIGLPLAILPTYAERSYGLNVLFAGILVSLQYIATFASRPFSGHLCDRSGPKRVVTLGLAACAGSGVLMAFTALTHHTPWLSLATLAISRLALGLGESMTATGAIMWGIGRIGTANTARVISWNGVATYSALAISAPIGAIIESRWGFAYVAVCVWLFSVAGLLIAVRLQTTTTPERKSVPLMSILRGVLPYGLALATGGMGFGIIAIFITLYFSHLQWLGASVSLSIYGVSFVMARLFFAGLIDRVGGYLVAIASFFVEAVGLALLAVPHRPCAFIGCALTGLGFSLIFPALGVEAADSFSPSVRGSVLGIYASFVDVSPFLAGPIAGAVIGAYGYPVVFICTSVAVLLALLGTLWLRWTKLQRPSPRAECWS